MYCIQLSRSMGGDAALEYAQLAAWFVSRHEGEE
jgi:hypothetical protein